MAGLHSKLGASKCPQWWHCTGSIRMCAGIPDTPSEHAEYGTTAHELAAKCLMEGLNAAQFKGQKWTNENGYTFTVDAEMVAGVQQYVDAIRATAMANPGCTVLVEHAFNLDWLCPGLDMFGTADCVIITVTGVIYVFDLKFGKGVLVEVKDNYQLKYYALGAMHGKYVAEVVSAIVQPRIDHPDGRRRECSYTPKHMYQWAAELKVRAQATLDPNAPCVPGWWCKKYFCKARAVCPAVRQQKCEAALMLLDPVANPEAQIVFPAPSELTPQQHARLAEFSALYDKWEKEVKQYQKTYLMGGGQIEGRKLVYGNWSYSWADEEKAKDLLTNHLKEDATKTTLVTVAQARALLKDKGLDPGIILEGLVARNRGVTVAASTSKREEYLGGVALLPKIGE